MAARLAAQARSGAVAAVSSLSHHDEQQPLDPGEVVELDVEIWPTCIVCRWVTASHSPSAQDYEYEGDAATLSNMKNPMRGCGPFVHDDPTDRPPRSSRQGDSALRLRRQASLLLPIIPSRQG